MGGRVRVEPSADGVLTVMLSGTWKAAEGLEPVAGVAAMLGRGGPTDHVAFSAQDLERWDGSLVTFVLALGELCEEHGVRLDTTGLPEGARRLFEIATAVPERAGAARSGKADSFLIRVGKSAQEAWQHTTDMVTFIGESVIVLGRWMTGRARYRKSDFYLTLQAVGADALGIVTIISLLVGLIIAFVGAVALEQFGAEIFTADLVGLAISRELAPIMTGIVMAGRTGAAFAAQLGTMRVNEEIDALTTFGFSAMEFLVLPRMLALALMMPLLVIYSDFIGLFGGWLVGVGMLDLTSTAYIGQTQGAIGLVDFGIGLVKGVIFGILVAVAGCMRGMQCGRSSAAVGVAATSAVVTGIVAIISTDAIFAVITNVLGI